MTRALALALATLAAGCAEDETAILLRVCSNVAAEDADTIQLRFEGPAGATNEYAWETAAVGLPARALELSLRPGAQFTGAFALTARLLDDHVEVVSRRIEVAFVTGEDLDATVLLDASCVEVACDPPQTCTRGACGPAGNGTDPCLGGGGQDAGPGDCDRDHDGVESIACEGADCDDDNVDVHPGVTDVCDQIDNDCSGEADDGAAGWAPGSAAYASFATIDETKPSVAWAEGAYAIAWAAERECVDEDDCDGFPCTDSRCDMSELRFVRYEPEAGTPEVDQQVVLSGVRPQVSGPPALAWNDRQVGVLYADEGVDALSIYFVSVDPVSGVASDPEQVSGADDAFGPALAWSGESWGGVWTEQIAGNQVLQLALITVSGDIDLQADVSPGSDNAISGAVDWGGSAFGITWISEDGSVWLQRASDDGEFDGEPTEVSDPGASAGEVVDVVWAGDGWVLAWEERVSGDTEIWAAKVDADGTLAVAPDTISEIGTRATEPDLAFSGGEIGLAWSAASDVFVLRLSTGLVPQGGAARMSREEDAVASAPRIAWSEERASFAVVWEDARLATDLDVWINELACGE